MAKENRLVVADKGWASTVPEWLRREVIMERMLDPDKVGDGELCVYLFTASLKAPMGHNMIRVYLHLSSKIMESKGMKLPLEVGDKLDPDQERELDQLRREIHKARGGRILI